MSKSTPATPPSRSPVRERRHHALAERAPAWRAGLIGTIIAHIVLALLAFWLPKNYFLPDVPVNDDAASRSFELRISEELAKSAPSEKEPLSASHFVEVNPAAPENPPDTTPNVGAQNQQVAQPEPSPETKSDAPKLDGKPEPDTTAIVSGELLEKPVPETVQFTPVFIPPTQESFLPEPDTAPAATPVTPAKESLPLPGTELLLGESDAGAGSTVVTAPGRPGLDTGPRVEGKPDGKTTGRGYFAGAPRIERTRPQARPSLATTAVKARPTETILNDQGTKTVGAVSYSAKWNAYGEYIQRLIDAVQVQWERLIIRSPVSPRSGTTVIVTFKINAAGAISEILNVESHGEKNAAYLCVSAITDRAPYGEWSEDMIALLGREQEMTFRFFYQ
jgi:hypothetical protein